MNNLTWVIMTNWQSRSKNVNSDTPHLCRRKHVG